MFVAINCLILLHALTGDRLDDFFNILRLLSFALTARPPDAAEAKTLQEYVCFRLQLSQKPRCLLGIQVPLIRYTQVRYPA